MKLSRIAHARIRRLVARGMRTRRSLGMDNKTLKYWANCHIRRHICN
jgi:hypothetical protein